MRPKSWTSNWRVLSHADGSSWVTFFYEDSLQQRILTDDNTAFVPIQTGGEIGIRTLAGPEAHYRFSRPTPSATWVFLRLRLVLPAGLEPAT